MINPFKEVNWRPGLAEKRTFARSLMLGFPALACVWLVVGRGTTGVWPLAPASLLAGIGAGVGAVLWLLPGVARPFYVAWYALACAIGMVVSNVLLSAFYFTCFTLFGWLRRASGRSPLKKGFDKKATTYWREAEPEPEPARYYRQF